MLGRLGAAICQAIVHRYGCDEFSRRLSDPSWFLSLGAVMDMDWQSSGITTSIKDSTRSGDISWPGVHRADAPLGFKGITMTSSLPQAPIPVYP